MTPKEKAENLLFKFTQNCGMDSARACAVISCIETIQALKTASGYLYGIIEITEIKRDIEYWEAVKIELTDK